MIVLNTAMAYELTEFRKKVDAKIEAGGYDLDPTTADTAK